MVAVSFFSVRLSFKAFRVTVAEDAPAGIVMCPGMSLKV
jgi:hypothetical protein